MSKAKAYCKQKLQKYEGAHKIKEPRVGVGISSMDRRPENANLHKANTWADQGIELSYRFDEDDDKHYVEAKDGNGEWAGHATFDHPRHPGHPTEADEVMVHPSHRRKGLATAMYNLAAEKGGLNIQPSNHQSDDAKKLWSTMAKSGEPQIASTAVINGKYLLMAKRRDNGKWTLPGGHMEGKESPEKGARRELFEESGIKADKMVYLVAEKVTGSDGKVRNIHAFATFGDYGTNVVHDPDGEVDRWYWVDTSKGLPEDIAKNLHSPKNVVLKAIGLQDY